MKQLGDKGKELDFFGNIEEVEQALIVELLTNADEVVDLILANLVPEHFENTLNREIINAVLSLNKQDLKISTNSIIQHLKDNNKKDYQNYKEYLDSLLIGVPVLNDVHSCIEIIVDNSKKKTLLKNINDIKDSASLYSVDTLLERLENNIASIAKKNSQNSLSGLSHISEVTKETAAYLENVYSSDSISTGVCSGFNDLDKKLSGLQRGDLIVIAGRPSMGKTSFALSIMDNIITQDYGVILFSLEMPQSQIMLRLLALYAGVSLYNLRIGKLSEAEKKRVDNGLLYYNDKPVYIDDNSILYPGSMRMRIRMAMRKLSKDFKNTELGVIIVDYLQLMSIPEYRSNNRVQELSEITRSLKSIAKEFKVPVVALSQLNREVESRQNKRPLLSDLRESGSIEQDADVVAMIYRDEVYNPSSDNQGIGEVIIAKQRNGPIGSLQLAFKKESASFTNKYENKFEL